MAHNGQYLVKVGNYEIPLSFIKLESYKSAPRQRQDNDSYVDADGYLHRFPMPHTRTKIEFEFINLTEAELRSVWDNITVNYINWLERDVTLEYYDEEYDTYLTGHFYLPGTVEFKWYNKNITGNNRLAFIEY